jgi:hypothetical protein
MNLSLLCKWWWKLEVESGLWQKIVKYKYLKKDSIVSVKHKQTDSLPYGLILSRLREYNYRVERGVLNMENQPCRGKTLGCMMIFYIPCHLISLSYVIRKI